MTRRGPGYPGKGSTQREFQIEYSAALTLDELYEMFVLNGQSMSSIATNNALGFRAGLTFQRLVHLGGQGLYSEGFLDKMHSFIQYPLVGDDIGCVSRHEQ